MERYTRYFIFGLLTCLAVGCNKPTVDSKPSEQSDKPEVQSLSPEEMAKREARVQKLNEQAKKLREEGKILGPRVDIQFEVVQTEGISQDDAQRSFAFKKATLSRCYQELLMFDETVKGEISVKLSRGTDQKIEVADLTTTIKDPDFLDCAKQGFEAWRLPEQAKIEARLTFTSRPAPTAEEIRAIHGNPKHAGHDHDHQPQPPVAQPPVAQPPVAQPDPSHDDHADHAH